MQVYRIQEGDISIPDDWRDKTMQLFVLPPNGGGEATVVISRDAETKASSLETYVDSQLAEAGKRLNGFQLLGREDFSVSGKPFIEISYVWITPERIQLHQSQAYAEWRNYFMIFTLTTRNSDFAGQRTAWRQLIESVNFRTPPE